MKREDYSIAKLLSRQEVGELLENVQSQVRMLPTELRSDASLHEYTYTKRMPLYGVVDFVGRRDGIVVTQIKDLGDKRGSFRFKFADRGKISFRYEEYATDAGPNDYPRYVSLIESTEALIDDETAVQELTELHGHLGRICSAGWAGENLYRYKSMLSYHF